MRCLILILFIGLACVCSAPGSAPAPDCPTSRADNPDIMQYKEHYKPQEFSPEPAVWQIADIVLMAALLVLAAVLVRRGKARPLTLIISAALLYFGLLRGGCICPVGAVANATLGLYRPEYVGRATAVIFMLPLIAAFFAGRIFCSSVCPLGACQHLTAKNTPVALPPVIHKISLLLAPLVLVAAIWAALSAAFFLICWLDPFKPAFFLGHTWTLQLKNLLSGELCEQKLLFACYWPDWLALILVLLLSYWITRPFCRFVCPYGVILGIFSVTGFHRRKINKEKCVYCGQCRQVCPVQAITIQKENAKAEISRYSCVQCNRCSNICPQNAIKQ